MQQHEGCCANCLLDYVHQASEGCPVVDRHTEGPEVKGFHEGWELPGSRHACAINARNVQHEWQV